MGEVLIEGKTIDAAGEAVHAMEAGRRVGWARAFTAERRADSAEHDVNILRDDARMLSEFCARCYGVLEAFVGTQRLTELVGVERHQAKSFMPDGAVTVGRAAGQRLLAQKEDELTRLRDDIAELKGQAQPLYKERWDRMRQRNLEQLMAQFSIPSAEELLGWLAQYSRERT